MSDGCVTAGIQTLVLLKFFTAMESAVSRRIKKFSAVVFFFISALNFAHFAYPETLRMFAGAGRRQPVDVLTEEFENQTGHQVLTEYAGGGQLMSRIAISGQGDVFVPGSLVYIQKLEEKKMIRSYRPIVLHTPVIGVNRDCADRITSFSDLAKPGVRLALGDPEAMAFGRTAMDICTRSGRKDDILKNVAVYGATVKQLALYVRQGSVDAAVIGRADAWQNRDEIVIVSIPAEYFQAEVIAAAVLESTSNAALADRLRNFLSNDHAVETFKGFGFLPLEK